MDELDVIRTAIAGRRGPVSVFFRDDDVGWANEELEALCERFNRYKVPLDLAVIPGSLDSGTAKEVIRIIRKYGSILGIHQHGYTHTNHQASGRKCEFGSARSRQEIFHDIERGQQRLHTVLGELIDPIFTPPWNRCTADTCKVLRQLGFLALSRISGSDSIDYSGLCAIPVTIDWQKKRSGEQLRAAAFGQYAAASFARDDVVGVMLHHEKLDGSELDRLCEFIACLAETETVQFRGMLQVCEMLTSVNGGDDNAVA